jgi:hypothetical protein
MGVNRDLVGVKGDECSCGRRSSKRHCTSCGSPRTYARMNRAHMHLNGELRMVPIQHRCQSCGHLFIDEEREFCEAPPVGVKLVAQRIRVLAEAQQKSEYLRPHDQKIVEAVREMLPNPKTNEPLKSYIELDREYRKIVYQLKLEYVDTNVELQREKKPIQTESMSDFVARRLKELNVVKPVDPEAQA